MLSTEELTKYNKRLDSEEDKQIINSGDDIMGCLLGANIEYMNETVEKCWNIARVDP